MSYRFPSLHSPHSSLLRLDSSVGWLIYQLFSLLRLRLTGIPQSTTQPTGTPSEDRTPSLEVHDDSFSVYLFAVSILIRIEEVLLVFEFYEGIPSWIVFIFFLHDAHFLDRPILLIFLLEFLLCGLVGQPTNEERLIGIICDIVFWGLEWVPFHQMFLYSDLVLLVLSEWFRSRYYDGLKLLHYKYSHIY